MHLFESNYYNIMLQQMKTIKNKRTGLLWAMLLCPFLSIAQEVKPFHAFTLKGTIENNKEGVSWVFLFHDDGRELIDYATPEGDQYYLTLGDITRKLSTRSRSYFDRDDVGFADSAQVINGTYEIKGIVSGPVTAILSAKDASGAFVKSGVRVFIAPGNMLCSHTESFETIKFKNSPENDAYEGLKKAAALHQQDPVKLTNFYLDFARAHPTSPLALHALQEASGGQYSLSLRDSSGEVERLFHTLPSAVRESPLGRKFAMRLEIGKLFKQLEPFNESSGSLTTRYYELRNAEKMDSADIIEAQLDKISKEVNATVFLPYVKNNPHSPAAYYALDQVVKSYAQPDEGFTRIAPYFALLPESVQMSVDGRKMYKSISLANQTTEGNIAPDFTQPDSTGKAVALSSFRGQYILLDFWASWCAPCRAENPHVVAAWNKYHEKGFQVVSVSLDSENARSKWLKAIYDDGMPWVHLSDLKGWKNEAAQMYGVKAIPSNFLIDPNGKIIAKNLRGEALAAKLAEVIK